MIWTEMRHLLRALSRRELVRHVAIVVEGL